MCADVSIAPDVSLKQRIFKCHQCRRQQHIAGSARVRKAVHSGTGKLEGSILKLQSFRTLLGRVWTLRGASWIIAQHSRASFFLIASFRRLSHVSDTFPTRFADFLTRFRRVLPTFRQLLTPKFNDVQDIIKSYHASKLHLNAEKLELLR